MTDSTPDNPERGRPERHAGRRRSQPPAMQTSRYVYGVEPLDGHLAWALFEAATEGDEVAVRALLQQDPRLVNAQFWYQFPLHRAVAGGHAGVVALLLEQGADPGESRYTYNSWDKLLESARERGFPVIERLLRDAMQRRFAYDPEFDRIVKALISRDLEQVDRLLREQPTWATASDALGNTGLHWSVITRNLAGLRRFVSAGTPVDALRADGHSAVLLAASGANDYWHREPRSPEHPSLRNTAVLVGSLLAQGAEYSLSVAAAMGDRERVEQILAVDPDAVHRLDTARVSPLARAARGGYLSIVQLLLDRGADPNRPEECAPEGRALYEACCGNHRELAQLLLERGANPNAGVDSCECCLTICEVAHGEQARGLQKLLESRGALRPPYRMTTEELKQALRERWPVVGHEEFLGCALRGCDAEMLDLLLQGIPDVLSQMEVADELTALQDPELLARLLDLGLDPTQPDWEGATLLERCRADTGHPLPGLWAGK